MPLPPLSSFAHCSRLVESVWQCRRVVGIIGIVSGCGVAATIETFFTYLGGSRIWEIGRSLKWLWLNRGRTGCSSSSIRLSVRNLKDREERRYNDVDVDDMHDIRSFIRHVSDVFTSSFLNVPVTSETPKPTPTSGARRSLRARAEKASGI